MTIWRPSMRGSDPTLATGSVFSFDALQTCQPRSWCDSHTAISV
jgi:hypothetical protein